jgi:molecular chaperone IbpA
MEDMTMHAFDFSPLYRSAIGFDRLASVLDEALRADTQPAYPPYNIEVMDEDKYRITMAVAGFTEADLELVVEQDMLKIAGKQEKEDAKRSYLYQGIAARSFERRFRLADHVRVSGARLENGLLHVELVREIPEALKPRRIEIRSADERPLIEGEAA